MVKKQRKPPQVVRVKHRKYTVPHPGPGYLSGQFHRRDGDVYGSKPSQWPQTTPFTLDNPDPTCRTGYDGDHPAGDLRPSNKR
jgi:hypothetical protein